MTILVTGGTGLVGPRLLPRLLAAGIDCRGLVRPGRDLPEGVERAEGDLDDVAGLQDAVRGVTAVVHFAAVFRTQDEAAIWRVNLEGTKHLIEAVRTVAPDARFVMASTGNVYAHDLDRPAREGDRTSTESAYAASKLAAEAELRGSGLTWAVLRLPFVYGDGDGHLEAIPAVNERWGLHPAHRFSVAHHADIANAVRWALTGAADGRIVNVTDDATVSVLDMARFGGADYPLSAEPVTLPWRGQMDGSRARSLGFAPEVLTIEQAAREGRL